MPKQHLNSIGKYIEKSGVQLKKISYFSLQSKYRNGENLPEIVNFTSSINIKSISNNENSFFIELQYDVSTLDVPVDLSLSFLIRIQLNTTIEKFKKESLWNDSNPEDILKNSGIIDELDKKIIIMQSLIDFDTPMFSKLLNSDLS
jgi:uncharacterized membrane protein